MKINLLWTAVIAELRFIKSPAETEIMKMTEIVEVTVMILTSEKWLFKVVAVLNSTDAALITVIIQN